MNSKQSLSFSRRSFLKTLGTASVAAPFVTSGLMAQSPNGIVRHASFGAAGQAGSDIHELTKFNDLKLVAVAEVDLRRRVTCGIIVAIVEGRAEGIADPRWLAIAMRLDSFKGRT